MQKITPHLWFDKQAKEAAEFYTTIFPNSQITSSQVLHNTPSGDCDILSFKLMNFSFMAISAGPTFKINPSISFMVNFDPAQMPDAESKIDEIWTKLADGAKILMPFDQYPFSKKYGWLEDKYGVSWQLILTDQAGQPRPAIIPSLLFTNQVYGKAEEAGNYYVSVFKNSESGMVAKYGPGQEPNKPDAAMFSDFKLEGQWFAAMDSALEHHFNFNEGVSLLINCESQEEIDYYWEKLSAVPEAEQCGWLKDKFGVSWQVHPVVLGEMMTTGTPEQVERVTQCFLKMKKFDIAELHKAFQGQ